MRTSQDPIVLNGSHGEGGGALFRTALCMSALTQKPLIIDSIRGATRKPGISAEDFPVLQALIRSCNASIDGAETGSKKLHFTPKNLPRPIQFQHDISRSGSGRSRGNSLVVVQTLAPILARAGAFSSLDIRGETHSNNALTFDAFELTTMPANLDQGIGIFPSIHQAGFGTAGRGHILVEIEPSAINPVQWSKRGGVVAAGARITTCDVHSQIVSDSVSAALKRLQDAGYGDQIDHIELSGPEPGACVTFWIKFEQGYGSASSCWNRGTQMIDTINKAWHDFTNFSETTATVDPFLADQILLPACLADGTTTFSTSVITRRIKTIAWVIKEFIPIAITIKGTEGSPGSITVQR